MQLKDFRVQFLQLAGEAGRETKPFGTEDLKDINRNRLPRGNIRIGVLISSAQNMNGLLRGNRRAGQASDSLLESARASRHGRRYETFFHLNAKI
jgi:hypothetical protein